MTPFSSSLDASPETNSRGDSVCSITSAAQINWKLPSGTVGRMNCSAITGRA